MTEHTSGTSDLKNILAILCSDCVHSKILISFSKMHFTAAIRLQGCLHTPRPCIVHNCSPCIYFLLVTKKTKPCIVRFRFPNFCKAQLLIKIIFLYYHNFQGHVRIALFHPPMHLLFLRCFRDKSVYYESCENSRWFHVLFLISGGEKFIFQQAIHLNVGEAVPG